MPGRRWHAVCSRGYNPYFMDSKPANHAHVDPSADALRDALRFWTTGVAIVSTKHDGTIHGMTLNSFTSLSLDPPLVSVALEKKTRTHQLVRASGVFAVTLLAQEQSALSDKFAGRDRAGQDRFDGVETFTIETGSPILSHGLAFFDCRVHASYDAGTHTVIIGAVLACGPIDGSTEPLVYFNRGYRKISSVDS